MKNILLVNDDGYDSEGIIVLERLILKLGRVFKFAPKEHMSGKGMSLSLFSPIYYEKISEDHYKIDATPTSCIDVAIALTKMKFDLCFSGINSGPNLAQDTLYSGTLGAALEANINHIPSIAFSCFENYALVEKYFDAVMQFIDERHLLNKVCTANVNFPKGEEVKGILLTKVASREDIYHPHIQGEAIRFSRDIGSIQKELTYDQHAIEEGYISISVILPSYTLDESAYR